MELIVAELRSEPCTPLCVELLRCHLHTQGCQYWLSLVATSLCFNVWVWYTLTEVRKHILGLRKMA